MTEHPPPRAPPSSVAPRPTAEILCFGGLLGSGELMQNLFATLARAAPLDAPVLITGGRGSGKTLAAQALHEAGQRRTKPLLFVDCGVSPSQLAERLGAPATEKSPFVAASGGTVVLEEVAAVPLPIQAQLLGMLDQERSREQCGTKPPRIVATTSVSLESQAARGMFRRDLLERLAVVPFVLPPLRDRPEDVPLLAAHFLELVQASRPAAQRVALRQPACRALAAHDWPGNVAELRAVVEHFVRLGEPRLPSTTEAIDLSSPWGTLLGPAQFDAKTSYREARTQFECEFEQRYVAWLLRRHGGNVSAAAREARMDRKHLSDLAKRHGLRRVPSTRPPAK